MHIFIRGIAKDDLKDYHGAIADLTKATELNPKEASAYFYRGIAKDKLEDYRGAIDDFTKVIELDTKMQRHILKEGF